ncbi:FecR family protein [Sphingopyxis sp. LARHCG72]
MNGMTDNDAAAWAVRRETMGDNPRFQAELDAWLAGDPRRSGDLLKAEATLSFLNRGRALPGSAEDADDDAAASVPAMFSRRRLLLGGGAGALAAGVAGLALFRSAGEDYRTGFGEVREMALADGSTASINTDTDLYVAITGSARRLRLVHGEAWFAVRKDSARPFEVEAGDVRVRALGTAFSVRRKGSEVEILVTHGTVETSVAGFERERVRASAGTRVVAAAGRPPQAIVAPRDVENALAWRRGEIILDGMPLGDAAAEFNRYNARKIVIADPAFAQERMVGQFRMREPEAFVRAVRDALGARVADSGATLRIYGPGAHAAAR